MILNEWYNNSGISQNNEPYIVASYSRKKKIELNLDTAVADPHQAWVSMPTASCHIPITALPTTTQETIHRGKHPNCSKKEKCIEWLWFGTWVEWELEGSDHASTTG